MNLIETFQSHPVAPGLPTGWVELWEPSVKWSITEEGGDRMLVRHSNAANLRSCATYVPVNSDANRANIEILLVVRPSAIVTGSICGAILRGSGASAAVANGYGCLMYGPDKLRFVKYVSGVASFLNNTDVGPNFTAAFAFIRFRVNDTTLQAKYWTGLLTDEPSAWTIEATDTSIGGAGTAGLTAYSAGVTTVFSQVAIATNGETATFTVDLSPPNLTSIAAAAASATSANGSVTTDKGNGTLYYLASTNASETKETIKAGGVRSGSMPISSVGAKPYTVTGLSPVTTYFLHNVQTSSNGVDSDVESSSSFTTPAAEVGAPTLSGEASSQTGSSTATAQVSTNRNSGTMYLSLLTTPSAPSAAALRAGTGAVFAQGKPVTDSGVPQAFVITGLSPSTTYYPYLHQVDGNGNESAVVSAPSFTTAASGTKGIRKEFFDGTATKANITGISAVWWDIDTPHLFGSTLPKLSINSASTDASGVLQLSLAGLTSLPIGGSGFLQLFKLDGADRENSIEWGGILDVVDIS